MARTVKAKLWRGFWWAVLSGSVVATVWTAPWLLTALVAIVAGIALDILYGERGEPQI